jgi:DNA polymerase III sliding clamp (beta) subunit (PCNA family)
VLKAVAKKDYRPVLTGVYFEFDGEHLTLTGADSYRLHTIQVECDLPAQVVLLNRTDVKVMADKLVQSPVQINFADPFVHFVQTHKGKERVMTCRTVFGKYPDWHAMLPVDYKKTHTAVQFSDEQNGLTRLRIIRDVFADYCTLSFTPGQLTVKSHVNPFTAVLSMSTHTTAELDVHVNVSYLYDAEQPHASNLPPTTYWFNGVQPIVVTYSDPGKKAVIMPCSSRS